MSPVIRKKKKKFHLPPKYWLLIVSAMCVAIMVLSLTTTVISTPLYAIANYAVVPLENGISHVGSFFVTRAEMMSKIQDLLAENKDLQGQVDDLIEENTNLQQERYELTRLRELYNLDEQYASYQKTGARVIAKDAGNWYHSFIIDKGSKDGIATDMNVLSGSGLVGRVTDVGPDWAKVVSIIDDDSNVSASVLSTSDSLIVSGSLQEYAGGVIDFSMLQDTADQVVEGDKIVTSNISDKYLPGILIGYISSIEKDSNNLTKSGTITPAVDFAHIDTVLVILDTKQTVSDEDIAAAEAAMSASAAAAASSDAAEESTASGGSTDNTADTAEQTPADNTADGTAAGDAAAENAAAGTPAGTADQTPADGNAN